MSTAPATPEAEIQALLYQVIPLYDVIGLTVEHCRDGLFRCRLPMNRVTVNHIGTMHAALQWALAEVLGGVAVLSIFTPKGFAGLYAAVTWAEVEFVKPAREALIAETRLSDVEQERIRTAVTSGGEGRFDLEVPVKREDGTTVATLRAKYIVRPKRQPA